MPPQSIVSKTDNEKLYVMVTVIVIAILIVFVVVDMSETQTN